MKSFEESCKLIDRVNSKFLMEYGKKASEVENEKGRAG